MTVSKDDIQLDISEKGRKKDGTPISLDRRLFIQFLAFGRCRDTKPLIERLEESGVDGALYLDINDPYGVGLITMNENPDFFVSQLRNVLNQPPFTELIPKSEFTMLGRTYSFGYEHDLEEALINEPRRRILDRDWPWAIWYPLQRVKSFENLPEDEQRAVLGEHGKVGFKYGRAGYARDIRLACHGLDKNDNDFVIGLLGRELYPLSSVVQSMRKTRQTSMYLENLGPFFIGKAIWQSEF
ncbi:MAG TPA: chlorite dismutase family protein [Thermodesulfobacteriota bacterium]|jgi:chlorite dismutase|nr:chlorite dismutase family protein [Thermodesulfobacteriota bacterium]